MVTYSKYGRQATSKEVGKNRIAIHDAEKTASKSYIVKNNYGFSITDFNKGVALYKNMYLGLFSIEDVSKYITWLSNNEVNFDENIYVNILLPKNATGNLVIYKVEGYEYDEDEYDEDDENEEEEESENE